MIITVYSMKGGEGKTPISSSIALDLTYAVGTNEGIDVYSHLLDPESIISVAQDEVFPTIDPSSDIVFDLSGSISKKSVSITSAIKQSALVIVPISNNFRNLSGGITTIREVSKFTKNILVVATKIKKSKPKKDEKKKESSLFGYDWRECDDFKNIDFQIKQNIDFEVPVLPLKLSNAFDAIDDEERGILEMVETDKLKAHWYKTEAEQLNQIYNFIQNYE